MNTQAIDNASMPSLETVSEEEFTDEEVDVDYPFTTWTDLYEALTEALQTEFACETYPKWAEEGYPVYSQVKRIMKTGVDKQMVCDQIVDLLCHDGARYASDFAPDCCDALALLIKLGATLPMHHLFDSWQEDIEDELAGYEARAAILDRFGPKGKITVPAELKGIKPEYCEEVSDELTPEEFDQVRYAHLIALSEYLKTVV